MLRCPVAAHIPSSRAVPLSINNGTPITQANPEHPVSRAIIRFAQQRLLGMPATAAHGGPATGLQEDGMSSLASRITQRQTQGAAPGDAPGALRRAAGYADPFAVVKHSVHAALLETLGPKLYDANIDQRDLERRVTETLQGVLQRDETPLTAADRAPRIPGRRRTTSWATAARALLRDPDVTEIMVNGPDRMFVERFGQIDQVDAAFVDEEPPPPGHRQDRGRVGRRVDEASPMVDARLPDGSRVNAVVPPSRSTGRC